jgi:4-amino-4-deoxy-L-arabinose transferase-like glycosyltransferase
VALKKPWAALALAAIGFFAYFQNLDVALFEGSEGLYAHIAREMTQRGEFLHLTYLGTPYVNKTPFSFWLLALSTDLFGENEVALRLPGALFSLGTMVVTYGLGRMLFSPSAAFTAALVVATNHVFLWYGRRVLFDAGLTFFITLALYCWARACLAGRSPWWHIGAFVAMTLGTMTKAMQAAALPLLVIVLHALISRDARALKAPLFWMGAVLCASVVGVYYWVLGPAIQHHFLVDEIQHRVFSLKHLKEFHGDLPLYWYLGILWFDFFPWSALLPSLVALVIYSRPLRRNPPLLLAVLWFFGFLVAFSLAFAKREPYLLPMVPGLGLLMGYYYDAVYRPAAPPVPVMALARLMLGVVAIVFAFALFLATSLLAKRWFISASPFPLPYVLAILALGASLLYAVARGNLPRALVLNGCLAVGFMVGVIQFVLPAISQANSARALADEVRAAGRASSTPLVLFFPKWPSNEDALFYLTLPPGIPEMRTTEDLLALARQTDRVLVATNRQFLERLSARPEFVITPSREFRQPRNKHILLVAVEIAKPDLTRR